jgi:hypothetical protein
MQHQVLGLVRKCVDVSARVLGHHHDAGGTGPRLGGARSMVAMQEVVEAGGVRGVRWRACVTELLEVEDAG